MVKFYSNRNQDATASFVFRANPPPTSVRWIVEKPTENNGGNETAANNTSGELLMTTT